MKTGFDKIVSLLADISMTLNGLVAVLSLAESQKWTPSCEQELKLVLLLYSDLISFGEMITKSDKTPPIDPLNPSKGHSTNSLMKKFRRVILSCFQFIDQNVQVNHVADSSQSKPSNFNLK